MVLSVKDSQLEHFAHPPPAEKRMRHAVVSQVEKSVRLNRIFLTKRTVAFYFFTPICLEHFSLSKIFLQGQIDRMLVRRRHVSVCLQ